MSAKVAIDTDPTMSAIRSILHESAPTSAAPNLKAQTQEAIAASLHSANAHKVKVESTITKAIEDNVRPHENATDPSEKIPNQVKSRNRSLLGRLGLPFQPKRKHMVWAGFALAIVLRPYWFLLAFVLTIIVFLGTCAVFGANKTWGGVMWTFNIFARRSPERAKRFAKRMDWAAMRWDGFLDRFPEGTVDGLYLPDFQSIQAAEEQHDAVVDARLSRMHAGG